MQKLSQGMVLWSVKKLSTFRRKLNDAACTNWPDMCHVTLMKKLVNYSSQTSKNHNYSSTHIWNIIKVYHTQNGTGLETKHSILCITMYITVFCITWVSVVDKTCQEGN